MNDPATPLDEDPTSPGHRSVKDPDHTSPSRARALHLFPGGGVRKAISPSCASCSPSLQATVRGRGRWGGGGWRGRGRAGVCVRGSFSVTRELLPPLHSLPVGLARVQGLGFRV